MSPTDTAFELDQFERVPATADSTLLRLAGRFRAPDPRALGIPVLVVDDGSREHRLTSLPGPSSDASAGPDGDSWRAAYPIGAALGGDVAGCWLELEGGDRVELPEPAEHRLSERASRAVIDERTPPVGSEPAKRELAQLRDREREANHRLADLEHQRHATQRKLAAAEAALQAAHAERTEVAVLQARAEQLESARHDLGAEVER
ncbi:MAG: hypothetical protein M3018_03465, partial [Actinomycetota bacterium]|nr:hypothetical protein [Actinomycetota bacterium]